MKPFSSGNPKDAVSPAIKITVIALTVLLLIGFVVFFAMLMNRVNSPSNSKSWDTPLKTTADRLKKDGLKEQAAALYIKFLDRTPVDRATRAEVSMTIGKLYQDMGNCREALVWFYQADLAQPAAERQEDLNRSIQTCRNQVGAAHMTK